MRVLVHFAEGFEEIEALAVVDILRRAGIETATVSVTGDKVVVSTKNIKVVCDLLFEEADYSKADMIVLPGGMPGTKNLDAHIGLKGKIEQFYNDKKWLAAICAAPMVYGKMGLLQGERAICYPGVETELKGAEIVKEEVVVSGKFITSMGPGTAMAFGYKIVEILQGKESADKLKKAMIYMALE